MNDEIKEILDYLKRSDKNKFGFEQGKLIDYEETQLLLDYITNLQQDNTMYAQLKDEYEEEIKDLQQENERLKKELNNKEFVFVGTAQNKTRDFIKNLIKEKNDYKLRCEKASDNLKRNYWIKEHEHNDDVVNMTLNILQNGSDDNAK